MKFGKLCVILLISSGIITSCNVKQENNLPKHAKYVFYFIGDGMGIAHVQMTEAYMHAVKQETVGFDELSFDTLPVHGFATTHANNRLITGSAAAGTALATGHKTNISHISTSPDGKENFESIAEKFRDNGMKIGIITSVSIDHATPSVFYAHQNRRKYYYSIGKDLVNSDFDFFAGGGFLDADSLPEENLFDLAANNRYHVVNKLEEVSAIPDSEKVILMNPVLGENMEMPYAIDRKYEGGYTLAQFTREGINRLYNDEEGFFMMVEGGKIDWASHDNDAAAIVHEVIDFDLAVQEALKFYLQHPLETLIVVTADHETGGLSLGNAYKGYESDFALLDNQKMSFDRLSRLLKLGDISKDEMMDIFGVQDLNTWEKSIVQRAENPDSNPDKYIDYASYDPLATSYKSIVNYRSGAGFTTWKHSGSPVPVYVIGNQQEMFVGKYDNTDIPKRILKAVGLEF